MGIKLSRSQLLPFRFTQKSFDLSAAACCLSDHRCSSFSLCNPLFSSLHFAVFTNCPLSGDCLLWGTAWTQLVLLIADDGSLRRQWYIAGRELRVPSAKWTTLRIGTGHHISRRGVYFIGPICCELCRESRSFQPSGNSRNSCLAAPFSVFRPALRYSRLLLQHKLTLESHLANYRIAVCYRSVWACRRASFKFELRSC